MRPELKIIGAFLIGGVIGATVALLYAPQSGKETRREIKKRAKELRKKTKKAVENLYSEVEELAETLKDRLKEIKERGQELTSDAKKEILYQIEKLLKILQERKKALESLIEGK
ncbi:MAG: YtxH domain-containing protein [Thermodesulfovibrio sp.]|nr:YtxH domain-containing protein [Thermodesulfovibrio sp.]